MNAVNYASSCDGFTKYVNKLSNNEINGRVVGVYIGSNEENKKATFDCLENGTSNPESCHVGFSSWFNFDIIVKRKSSRAVLIDFNPNTKDFMVKTLDCVISSNCRVDFLDKIHKYISENESKFTQNFSEGYEECGGPQDEVFCEMKAENGWLSTDEGYKCIKKLATEGKIAVITEDIRTHEKLKRLANVVNENGFTVDTLYLSNICKYMSGKEDKESYVKSVNFLSGSETKIIHCLYDLKQEVIEVKKLEGGSQDQKISESLLIPGSYEARMHAKYKAMSISEIQALIKQMDDSFLVKK